MKNKKQAKFNIETSKREDRAFSRLHNISLNDEERAKLRLQLEAHMSNYRPSSNKLPELQKDTWVSLWLSWRRLSLLAVPALIFTITSVSQASLPGQPLYAIKTSVNEPLRRAVIFNSEQRLDFETKLVDERVREARALKERGQLTTQRADQIHDRITALADNVVDLRSTVEVMEGADVDRSNHGRVAIAQFNGRVEGSLNALRALVDQEVAQHDDLTEDSLVLAERNEETDNELVNDDENYGVGGSLDQEAENVAEDLIQNDTQVLSVADDEDDQLRNNNILQPFDLNLNRQQRVEREFLRQEARVHLVKTMEKIKKVVNEDDNLSDNAREFLAGKMILISQAINSDSGEFAFDADLLEVISSAVAAEAFIDALDNSR